MLEKGTKVLVDTGVSKIKGTIIDVNLYRDKGSMYEVLIDDLRMSIFVGESQLTVLQG